MSSAPTHLVRCPLCLALHPWREAPRSALSVERVQSHTCPHGIPCGVRLCEHGKSYGEVSVDVGEGPTVLRPCKGTSICVDKAPRCQVCAEERAKFFAAMRGHRRENTCKTCREVVRQSGERAQSHGTICITVKRKKEGKDLVCVPNPHGCYFEDGTRPPPWCAGATTEEQKVFLEALPDPMRATALEEARRANKQEGAAQKVEAPKVEKKKKEDKQRSLF